MQITRLPSFTAMELTVRMRRTHFPQHMHQLVLPIHSEQQTKVFFFKKGIVPERSDQISYVSK